MTDTDNDPLAPRHVSRLVLGLAVQPVVAAVLGFVSFPVLEYAERTLHGGSSVDSLDAAIAVALGSAIVAGIVTLVGAFPVVAWRLNRGPFTLSEVLWWGVALGNLPLILIATLATISGNTQPGSSSPPVVLRGLVAGSVFGLAGAGVFWFVAVRGSIHDARLR
jgi:hypothetical protein